MTFKFNDNNSLNSFAYSHLSLLGRDAGYANDMTNMSRKDSVFQSQILNQKINESEEFKKLSRDSFESSILKSDIQIHGSDDEFDWEESNQEFS